MVMICSLRERLRRPISAARVVDFPQPAGPVMSTFDLLEDPHFTERGFVVELDHPEVGPRAVAGLPARFSAMPDVAYFHAPLLGQHNDYVFGELLGLDADQMQQMADEKVIY